MTIHSLSNNTYTQPIRYAIADSGCTSTYISSNTPHINKQPCEPIRVTLPDGRQILSNEKGELCFPHLPPPVKQAHIFPDLHNKALLSLGTFCDNDYSIKLTKNKIDITSNDNNEINLSGHRDQLTSLWLINIEAVQDQKTAPSVIHNGGPLGVPADSSSSSF